MLWLGYSLVCALSQATSDALSKKALEKEDPLMVAWVRMGSVGSYTAEDGTARA